MSRVAKLLLAAIVCGGLLLRLLGLSHDLWEGYSYHPDSPKQMRAVQMFLRGTYFIHIGNSDWDGYPYFFPHLLEYACRLYLTVAQGTFRLLGIQHALDYPQYLTLYWLARLANVLFSAATILVAARIGARAFGPAAGLSAALFVAVSPIDVVACHYEGADTSAAFFSAVAVLFAIRVYDRGRPFDYVLGTFFATCALAAKYHAGMSLVPILVAHTLRARSLAELLSRGSLGRVALIGVTGAISLPLTIPPLFTHFFAQIQDILAFFRHLDESTRMRLPEVAALGTIQRLRYSLGYHLPIVAKLTSLPLAMLLLAAPLLLRSAGRRLAVLFSMPALYIIVGIGFRPAAHPVYHTLVTPVAFAIAAASLVALAPRSWRERPIRAVAVACVLAASVALLTRSSLRESYFFYHSDTRRLAAEWTRENVPRAFSHQSPAYGFRRGEDADPADPKVPGTLVVSSSIRRTAAGKEAFLLRRFRLEDPFSLPVFRNPVLELFLETPLLRKGFAVPPLSPLPSAGVNDLVFLGGPEFYRSARRLWVDRGSPVTRTLVSERPLGDVLVLLQNGAEPSTLSLSIAGRERSILLGSRQATSITVDRPRTSFPSDEGRFLYPLRASTSAGSVQVTVAITEPEKGSGLYEQGAFAAAQPWLAKAAVESRDPALAAMAEVSERLAGSLTPDPAVEALAGPLVGGLATDRLNEIYGGAPKYLAALEYLTFQAEKVTLRRGFNPVEDPLASGGAAARAGEKGIERWLSVLLPVPSPGAYVLTLRARARSRDDGPARIRVTLSHSSESYEIAAEPLALDADGFEERRFAIPVPSFATRWKLTLALDRDSPPLVIDRLTLAPDLSANLGALGKLVRLARGEDARTGVADVSAHRPLLLLAEQALERGERNRARRYANAAVSSLPRERAAELGREGIDGLLARMSAAKPKAVLRECDVVFDGGVRLTGFRIEDPSVAPGGTLRFGLSWAASDTTRNLEGASVFTHFLDDRGKVAFQSERRLIDFLAAPPLPDQPSPGLQSVVVPAHLAPGTYEVRVGVYLPTGRLAPSSSDLPTVKSAAVLPERIVVGG